MLCLYNLAKWAQVSKLDLCVLHVTALLPRLSERTEKLSALEIGMCMLWFAQLFFFMETIKLRLTVRLFSNYLVLEVQRCPLQIPIWKSVGV